MKRPLETAWANHSEKLHGPPYEREAATPQSLNETCKIQSQVTHKVQTRTVRSAVERFVRAVRLAFCDLNKENRGWASHVCFAKAFSDHSYLEFHTKST